MPKVGLTVHTPATYDYIGDYAATYRAGHVKCTSSTAPSHMVENLFE